MAVGIMEVRLMGARGLKNTDLFGGYICLPFIAICKMDPYVVLQYGNEKHTSTTAQGQGSSPVWNEEFKFRVEFPAPKGDDQNYKLFLQIMDRHTSDSSLGHATIYLKGLFEIGVEKGRAELGIRKYRVVLNDLTYHGEIQVGITFTVKDEIDQQKYLVEEESQQ